MTTKQGFVVPAGGGTHFDMGAPGRLADVKLVGHETNEKPPGGAGQRAIAMPTLTFAPSKRPLRVRRRVHGGARTWSDACCPSGGGVSRSYAPAGFAGEPRTWSDARCPSGGGVSRSYALRRLR